MRGKEGHVIAGRLGDHFHQIIRDLPILFLRPPRVLRADVTGDEKPALVRIEGRIHVDRPLLGRARQKFLIIIDGQKRFGFGDHFSKFTNLVDEQLLSKYEKLISDLKCENGACMFQCISRDNQIYNIEFSYRLDGIKSWERIERLRGINQLKMMVDLALGERVSDNSFIVHESQEMCLGYVIWALPGKISKIDGKTELYSRDDLIVLSDRFNEGDTVLNVLDMRSIAFIIEVFGMTYKEIKDKIIDINKKLHFYDENMHEMLMHREPDYENW